MWCVPEMVGGSWDQLQAAVMDGATIDEFLVSFPRASSDQAIGAERILTRG
jgi:hypothetical protein